MLCDYLGNFWWTTPEIDLGKLNEGIRWLPNSFKKLKSDLAILSPEGRISHPVVWLNTEGEFRFETVLDKVDVRAWDSAPGLTNLEGHLVVEDGRGYLEFEASETELSFQDLFRNVQHFQAASGRVDWWFDDNDLRVDSQALSLNSERIDALLAFAFEWEFPSDEARFTLDVSISKGMGGQVLEYLPNNIDEELLDWLDLALDDTAVEGGRLLYTTTIDPAAPVLDTLIIDTDLSGEQFTFNELWPDVDQYSGHFELNNHDLIARVSGTSLGNPIDEINVIFPDIWKEDSSLIDISLQSQSRAKRYLRYIKNSPLDDVMGETLSSWEMTGELVVHGDFSIDLATDDVAKMNFDVFPQKASVEIPGIPRVDDLKGVISYSDADQLKVRGLKGKALDGHVEFGLETPRW